MSNLSRDFFIQAIESVRSGVPPKDVFPENFLCLVGEENYKSLLTEAIEQIWIPIGDKAFMRNGYTNAVQEIEHYFYPPEPQPEYDYDFIDEFIF